MPGTVNHTQVPLYAGPAFYRSPPASALPKPKRSLHSLNGSGAQGNAERPSNGDGDKAVPVTSDKSHEGKGAVSETKEQDEPVDTKPKATFSASYQVYLAFENLAKRIRDDEDNGMRKRQPVSEEEEEEEELRRRQQAIIDGFEAQTTTTPTIQPAPPQATNALRDQPFTIPANVQRSAQEMQQKWMDQQIRTTGQRAVAWLAAYHQNTTLLLQLLNRRLERNLARQRELRRQQGLDETDDEIEHGQIPADDEGPRQTGNSNSDDGNGVAGIEDEAGLVTSTRQTTIQASEETTVGNGMVTPKDTKEGEEAEEAGYLMEIGGIDDECSCSMV